MDIYIKSSAEDVNTEAANVKFVKIDIYEKSSTCDVISNTGC